MLLPVSHTCYFPLFGMGCSLIGRASDRHAADAGSIPRCGKGFSSQRPYSVQTLLRCPYALVCNRMHYICAHVKDPVVHVRVRRVIATQTYPAGTMATKNNQLDDCGRSIERKRRRRSSLKSMVSVGTSLVVPRRTLIVSVTYTLSSFCNNFACGIVTRPSSWTLS